VGALCVVLLEHETVSVAAAETITVNRHSPITSPCCPFRSVLALVHSTLHHHPGVRQCFQTYVR
jgi:hypothetical protein